MPVGATDQKSLFSPLEVCSILKACAEANVTELKFGDLHVFFGASPLDAQLSARAPTPEAEISEQQTQIERRILEIEEARTKEDLLAEAILQDPSLAEELLISGDLTDGERDAEEA